MAVLSDRCNPVLRASSGVHGGAGSSLIGKDSKTYDATLRNLELIGEAVRQIPDDVKQQRPEIPWRDIAATRNYLTHVYFGVDNDIIWDIVTEKLAPLVEALRAIEFQTIDGNSEPYESDRSARGT